MYVGSGSLTYMDIHAHIYHMHVHVRARLGNTHNRHAGIKKNIGADSGPQTAVFELVGFHQLGLCVHTTCLIHHIIYIPKCTRMICESTSPGNVGTIYKVCISSSSQLVMF